MADCRDNCDIVANTDQADADQDGVGNLCDNCVSKWNPLQTDTDQDSVGDECDCFCGDGVRCSTEQCDDGNVVNDDACSNACTVSTCGDGTINPGEECDDGDNVDNDLCTNDCRSRAIDYVALGDSFSAGEGNWPYEAGTDTHDNHCHRSGFSAYPRLLGQPVAYAPISVLDPFTDYSWTFRACSGAEIRHVVTHDYYEEAQILNLSADTDLVTLTVSGNDVGFARIIVDCVIGPCSDKLADGETIVDGVILDRLHSALLDIKLATQYNATVFILGYPTLFGETECDETDPWFAGSVSATEQIALNQLAVNLNNKIQAAAEFAGVHYVPVNFTGNRLCESPGPSWIWGFGVNPSNSGLFHPRAAGQDAYRDALQDYIEGLYASGWPRKANGLPENPDLISLPTQQPSSITAIVPSFGALFVTPDETVPCETNGQLYPGLAVRAVADGFAPGATVTFTITAPGEAPTTLGIFTADTEGAIDGTATVPLDPVTPVGVLFEAIGLNESGGEHYTNALAGISHPLGIDSDGDTIPDACDRCPGLNSANQDDADGDGVGDECDPCPTEFDNDADGDALCGSVDACPNDPLNDNDIDGICGDRDNCPGVANASQSDFDLDGVGDDCDDCWDTDFDGFGNPGFFNPGCGLDNCPDQYDATQHDSDFDGVGNACDNCPAAGNPTQVDGDNDRVGDVCDCAATDIGVFEAPHDLVGLMFITKELFEWAGDGAGSSQVYNVVRGRLSELPVGSGPSEACLEAATATAQVSDTELPAAGDGFYYLVRGRNACADGSYGFRSNGVERGTAICQ